MAISSWRPAPLQDEGWTTQPGRAPTARLRLTLHTVLTHYTGLRLGHLLRLILEQCTLVHFDLVLECGSVLLTGYHEVGGVFAWCRCLNHMVLSWFTMASADPQAKAGAYEQASSSEEGESDAPMGVTGTVGTTGTGKKAPPVRPPPPPLATASANPGPRHWLASGPPPPCPARAEYSVGSTSELPAVPPPTAGVLHAVVSTMSGSEANSIHITLPMPTGSSPSNWKYKVEVSLEREMLTPIGATGPKTAPSVATGARLLDEPYTATFNACPLSRLAHFAYYFSGTTRSGILHITIGLLMSFAVAGRKDDDKDDSDHDPDKDSGREPFQKWLGKVLHSMYEDGLM
ncbi:hypothetical protein AK812_SmicGene44284 [Symbiodinium microadriaticum]|uniref:Uncharacterized protein n=1 Tax=Symbiodinium microadriaticum TaxID=2951 RepID=A0A1Q9BYV1_SYMMI|nr:hypothetical protein AK812_SmicGene44284 [Symbiodinium microadriaticum]